MLGERDREILGFAAEHRFVLARQVARLVGISERSAADRLRKLEKARYFVREEGREGDSFAYLATDRAMRAAQSTLPVPRPIDPAVYRHEAALGWLALEARDGRFGPVRDVVTERRMRSHDGRTADRNDRYGVWLGGVGPGGRDRMHHPDLVIDTASGHRVAFELELTGKGRVRRERILEAYAAEPRIAQVVYLVENRSTGRAVQRSAARLGISGLINVQAVSMQPPARGNAGRGIERPGPGRPPSDTSRQRSDSSRPPSDTSRQRSNTSRQRSNTSRQRSDIGWEL